MKNHQSKGGSDAVHSSAKFMMLFAKYAEVQVSTETKTAVLSTMVKEKGEIDPTIMWNPRDKFPRKNKPSNRKLVLENA